LPIALDARIRAALDRAPRSEGRSFGIAAAEADAEAEMSATNAERTRPDVRVPEHVPGRQASPGGDDRSRVRGLASPDQPGVASPRRSFLPPPKARARGPLQTGGQPPTVIRNLDALFAADQHRRSTPPPAPRRADPSSGVQPLDPARFAQALLDKVERDFAPPAPIAPFAREEITAPIALDPEDPDLVALVPWYVRVYRRLFGG